MDETDPPQEETWAFLGSRVSRKDTRIHAWVCIGDDGANREMWFRAKGTYTIGGNYRVKVSRTDGAVTLHGKPTYVELNPDEDLRVKSAASHRAAELTLSRLALERVPRRRDPLDAAIEPLVTLARAVSPSQRDAFALYVMRSLFRAW